MASNRAQYAARKAAGICTICGKAKARKNRATCMACAEREARYAHKDPNYQLHQYPSITFTCAKCGRTVVTDGDRDHRTRFCSASCEKKYWRHPPHDYETKLINFRSVEEYASWERRTNEA